MDEILSRRTAATASAVLVVLIALLETVFRPLVTGTLELVLDAAVAVATMVIFLVVGLSLGQAFVAWLRSG
jgi:hypothetical protein